MDTPAQEVGTSAMTTAYWSNGLATLYQSDARDIPLPDGSVHCVVTSPPYWGLRDYGLAAWEGGDPGCEHKGRDSASAKAYRYDAQQRIPTGWYQSSGERLPVGLCHCGAHRQATGIGLEPTLAEWVANIVAASREVWRVLRDDGLYWINLGDSYWGGKGASNNTLGQLANRKSTTLNRQQDYVGRQGGMRPSDRRDQGIQPKTLLGQPWRAVFALQDDGWLLRSAIVWSKPNPMPESVIDRPTSAYEMLFLLAKGEETPQFWTHPDRPGTRTSPEPDYRWRDVATGLEYDEEPDAYSDDMTECPGCAGAGEITRQAGQVSLFDGIPTLVQDCDRCDGEGEVKRWKRVNLWTGHDYFYDADAVREKSTTGDMRRPYTSEGAFQMDGRPQWQRHGGEQRDFPTPGRNARNVWQIPTQGRPEAHFATFPDELPRRCILAGTSAHGVCAKCGAPWTRVVDVRYDNPGNRTTNGPRSLDNRGQTAGFAQRLERSTNTTDWQPSCECNADRIPATVLDPFVGSGTSVAVARSLGRRGIGIDLSVEYLGLARKRLSALRA